MKKAFHILISDDEEGMVSTLSMILRAAKYKISIARTGKQALDRIEQLRNTEDRIDLLVTDIQMPEMTGDELIEEMVRRKIRTPVIVITGFGTKELVIQLMRKGVSEYIDKPFTATEFLNRLNAFVSRLESDGQTAGDPLLQDNAEKSVHLKRELDTFKESFETLRQQVDEAVHTYKDLVSIQPEDYKTSIVYRSRPVADLGGDYAGVVEQGDCCHLLLADVAGHDMGASYHTIMVKSIFEEGARKGISGSDLFSLINHALLENPARRIATAVSLKLDYRKMEAEILSAAHLPIIHVPSDHSLKPIYVAGIPLGVNAMANYASRKISFAEKDRFVLYTDGLPNLQRVAGKTGKTEKLSASGLDRLIELYNALDLNSMIDKIWTSAFEFSRKKAGDDCLLLIAEAGRRTECSA